MIFPHSLSLLHSSSKRHYRKKTVGSRDGLYGLQQNLQTRLLSIPLYLSSNIRLQISAEYVQITRITRITAAPSVKRRL